MDTKKWIWFVLWITIMLTCATCYLPAQDTTTPSDSTESKGEKDYTLWGLIQASGAVGYLIIGLSIVAMALVIEHFVNLQRNKLIPPDLLQDIEDLMEEEAYEEVMETCTAEPGFLTNTIATALTKVEDGYNAMMESVKGVIEEESIKLQQKISWLQLIASLAPMLGLLGTVWGMIVSFHRIAVMEGAPKPKHLADGIYLALVTTCEGLLVAIPALFFYFYFRNKVVRISMEIAGVAEELLDRFRKAG